MFHRSTLLFAGLLALSTGCAGSGGGSGSGFGVARNEIALGSGRDSVQLSWDAPRSDMSGAPVNDQIGFRLYHRVVPGSFEAVTVGAVNGVLIHGLDAGNHEFTVTTVTPEGMESNPSSPVQVSLP